MLKKSFALILSLSNAYIYRKAIANDAAAANVQNYIHKLFKEMDALNGPKIPTLVHQSFVCFSAATIIYLVCAIVCIYCVSLICCNVFFQFAKKVNKKDNKIENDKICYLMVSHSSSNYVNTYFKMYE